MSDLDACRTLLSIIDEMYEADGITPKLNEDPREACHSKTHDCATKVIHPTWGEGKPMYESHAVPTDEGYVAWYDVEFAHGIEKEVPAEDMEIITLAEHGAVNASEFKPHMMFHPETGEGVEVKKKADHDKYAKKGYVHDKKDVKKNVKEDDFDDQEPQTKTMPVNKSIELAGDSLYDEDRENPQSVNVEEINISGNEAYVVHDGPWKVYTDTGFEKAVCEMLGKECSWSEQGMQEDGVAHFDVEMLEQMRKLAGLNVNEAMMDAYGVPDCGAGEPEQQVDGSVSFRQEKNTDKGSVSIDASADDMQELAKVLQMAGLTLPKEMSGSSEASANDEEPEQEELLLPKTDDEANGDDAEKQNAKQTLVNIIKDKLQKRLK